MADLNVNAQRIEKKWKKFRVYVGFVSVYGQC